ncbi:MAG: hypothetical protein ACQERF_03850 [Actinomycetota bacterium]
MTMDDVRAAALRGLPEGDSALRAAVGASTAGQPTHVERLDIPGVGYWLVPFVDDDGRLRAVVQVDEHGQVAKAGVISAPDIQFLLAPELAAEAVGGEGQGRTRPRLVWQPCAESWDSFQPLWQFEGPEETVFVDQSGTMHRALHTDARGG